MRREFEAYGPIFGTEPYSWPTTSRGTDAFGELRQKGPALWRVVQDREESPLHGKAAPVVFGIAIK